MKILVTGASGFIGSYLIRELLNEESYSIYVLNRNPPSDSAANDRISYLNCDLSDDGFVNKLPEEVSIIIHLAQSNNYRSFPEKADDIYGINVHSTHLLLEWARKNAIKKFIYASSGNVYKRKSEKLVENDICLPSDYYGSTKFIGELMVKSYEPYFKISILRLFGVYGPGQRGMTIANIINKIRNNEIITLAKGVGLQFTPLFINDCVNMIKLVIKNDSTEKIYNLAGNEIVGLDYIVKTVANYLSVKPQIFFTKDSPIYMIGDSSLFVKSFEFKYETTIDFGLKKTISPY